MRALLDACVLYPTVMREILMGVARAGLIDPVWSPRILQEWQRTAERRHPGDGIVAEGEIARINAWFPDALHNHPDAVEAQLWLPDPGDIHVLASAISANCTTIITLNLRDFPRRELSGHGITAMHPDALLYALWIDTPNALADIASSVHSRAQSLAGAPLDQRKLLKRARLPRLAKALA